MKDLLAILLLLALLVALVVTYKGNPPDLEDTPIRELAGEGEGK